MAPKIHKPFVAIRLRRRGLIITPRELYRLAAPLLATLPAGLLLLAPIASVRGAEKIAHIVQSSEPAQDNTSAAVKRTMKEAEQLRARGTVESLRKAIEKYEEAIAA